MSDMMDTSDIQRPQSTSAPISQAPIPPSRVLGVFGMSLFTRESDLEDIFGAHGKIEKVEVIRNQGRSRGFGFIYFERQEDAEVAKEKVNGMVINERTLRVDYSRTGAPHAPTPGFYNGRPISEVIAERRDRYGGDRRRRDTRGGYEPRDSDRHYAPSRDRRRSRSRSRSPVRGRDYRDRGYARTSDRGYDRHERRRSRSRSRERR